MRHGSVLLALIITLGCASAQKDEGPPVEIRVQPIDNNSDLFTYRGPINVRFSVEVANPTGQSIILRRLDLNSGEGGPYTLRGSTPMNLEVGANASGSLSITVWARSRGSRVSSGEPVSIQGKAYFDSAKGPFVKIFQENIFPGN